MLKPILICILLLSVFSRNIRQNHKQQHHKKTRMFNSAFFEFENLGEKDYHLSAQDAQHWAQITVDSDISTKNHKSFIETRSEPVPGVVGNVVDLSKNVGVYSYAVTDYNGNILDTQTGDHLAEQLNADYLEKTSKIEDSAIRNLHGNNHP